MLYCSVDDHIKALSGYRGLAVTADRCYVQMHKDGVSRLTLYVHSDQRVIPGFLFIRTVEVLRLLNRFILDNKKKVTVAM